VQNNLSEQIRDCHRHAEDCARRAAAQSCPKLKQDFLDLERRWLVLARSYQFTERLTDFSVETKHNVDKIAEDLAASCKGQADKMNIRCAFVDENGLQCVATTGTPYGDGWSNLSVLRHGIDTKEGWYCRDHSGAALHELHDAADDKAA
jgi:hypothetical protein